MAPSGHFNVDVAWMLDRILNKWMLVFETWVVPFAFLLTDGIDL